MAVDARPIEIERVRDEERLFGGDIVWWVLLLVISVPIMLWGLSQTPTTFGFLVLSLGGIAAGVSFTQIAMRLPYLTNRFLFSLFLAMIAAAIICGVALLYNMTLPVPTPPPDVMYKPPISGG
jgi:hypothetical protein